MIHEAGARDWTSTSYDGEVWIDPASFDVQRFSMRTNELSPETNACEARMISDYARVHFDSGDFLIPRQSALRFLMRDTVETQVTSRYSGCREYRGQATLRFHDAPALNAAEPKAARTQKPLPPGLKITLAFASAIDTDTAAAGDLVVAKIRKPVRDERSKEILLPAGATVQGRILQMKHWLAPGSYHIAILLEALDVDGISSPLYARLDRPDELRSAQESSSGLRQPGTMIVLPPIGRPMTVGTFVFRTRNRRLVVPPNYQSTWTTTLPPVP